MSDQKELLAQNAKNLSEAFGFDEDATERLLLGVIGLVEYAVGKGEELNSELIHLATIHWFKQQEKFYNDYINNVDGARDKLHEEIYEMLKKEIDQSK